MNHPKQSEQREEALPPRLFGQLRDGEWFATEKMHRADDRVFVSSNEHAHALSLKDAAIEVHCAKVRNMYARIEEKDGEIERLRMMLNIIAEMAGRNSNGRVDYAKDAYGQIFKMATDGLKYSALSTGKQDNGNEG